MKDKIIRENIHFERRGKPLDKIGIGQTSYILSQMQKYADEFGWTEIMIPANHHPESATGESVAKWVDGYGGTILLFTSFPGHITEVGPIGVYWKKKSKIRPYDFHSDFESANPWATKERWEELMGINESINFERGAEPYDALNIGKKATAYIIRGVEREYSDNGLVKTHQDYLNSDENTWDESVPDDEVEDLLSNWEEEIDGSYSFWINAHDAEEDLEPEYVRATELEGDWVNWKGQVYKIPHTDLKKRYLGESMDFERGVDTLRAARVGVKRNIPKYERGLAIEVIEEAGFGFQTGDGDIKLEELWKNLADDMEEYGYYTLEEYYEVVDEDESMANPIIENAIEAYKWALAEYAKQYVWKPEAIKEIVKTLFYYKANPADVSFDTVVKWIDKALKLNWGIGESLDFERGQDPKTAMGIGNKDAQLIEKLRNLGYTFHWKEVPISIVIEDNDDVEELFQWENNIGEQLILYKLDLEHRTFYELQLRHKFNTPGHTEYFQNKDIMDPDKVWYYHNRFNESINFERGQDPYAALDIGRDRMKRKLISAAKEYAHENIPMHYLPTEKQYDDFANHTLKIIASGFNPEYIFDDIEGWFDEWREDQGITETQHFERGLEPKSAIGVGHAHLYPEKELFKRIYSYWEKVPETGWPYDFEELTPIRWTSPQPSFKVLVKSLQGEDGSGYTFYLTKEGVVAFWGHYVDAGGGRRSWRDEEYTIKDFKHFIRILESNHVQHMKLGESQNFERGKEPYKALDIGKYRTVKKGDKILVFYKGEVMKATALDDEDVDTKAERNFIDFEDEEGDRCWAVRSTTDPNVWLVPSANESFQKGKDVKEAIRIGTYSKLWAELEEMNGPDGFEFNEDFFHIIDNDYDTNNPAILTKLYKLLDMGKIFKSNVGEKSDHTEVILHQTPAGPIFSWDFDYGTGYAAPIEWWPKIEKTLLEIPVSRVEVMKQDGWNPEDPEEVKEFEEETLSNPKISNLIS